MLLCTCFAMNPHVTRHAKLKVNDIPYGMKILHRFYDCWQHRKLKSVNFYYLCCKDTKLLQFCNI